MFMLASAADHNNCFKYAADTRSGNMSAGIQFEPFMNTGLPLILKKNDLPVTQSITHTDSSGNNSKHTYLGVF